MPSARLYSSVLWAGGPGGQRLATVKSLVREIYLSASPFPTSTTRSFVLLFLLIYELSNGWRSTNFNPPVGFVGVRRVIRVMGRGESPEDGYRVGGANDDRRWI